MASESTFTTLTLHQIIRQTDFLMSSNINIHTHSGQHTLMVSRNTARKMTYLPLNCSDPDPSSSQQTPGQEVSHWEVWGQPLSGLEDLGPLGSDGMEDSPLSLGSAPEASPPAAKPESYTLSKDLTIKVI